MGFRKMLGIISIIIFSVFALMLTTSYAWYSYEKGSTKFDVVTANENVEIVFQTGNYINTDVAIPIKDVEIDRYSDKYDFNIRVKHKAVGNEMVAKINLVDIAIDDELKNIDEVLGDSPFRVDFFYQGRKVGNTITGKNFSSESYEIGDVVLSDDVDNQFELRVYLLDNGSDQSLLMNKSFQAKIDVNVISRVSTSFVSFENPDIVVSEILVDGKVSKSLPKDGFYDMNSVCEKGSNVQWNSLNRTLIYDKGSYVGDFCELRFTKSKIKRYLKDFPVGSYVQYVGNNGCSGLSCNGENANYVDVDNMGYCSDSNYHFITSGFRIAYIKDNTAYLVSAGSLECLCDKKNNSKDCVNFKEVDVDSFISYLDKISLKYCNSKYVYDGVCNDDSVWSLRFSDVDNMLNNSDSYQNSLIDNGGYYWYINSLSKEIFSWNPTVRDFSNEKNSVYGVRPVIRMDSSVLVVGGSGTYEDPYVIEK